LILHINGKMECALFKAVITWVLKIKLKKREGQIHEF
jgi:hypothetical protein